MGGGRFNVQRERRGARTALLLSPANPLGLLVAFDVNDVHAAIGAALRANGVGQVQRVALLALYQVDTW